MAGAGTFAKVPTAAARCSQRERAKFENRASKVFVFKIIPHIPMAVAVALGLLVGAPGAFAADDFPFVGDYTQNVPCKGDGTDPVSAKVKISSKEIVSNIGPCTILDTRKDGETVTAHVECKLPAGPLIGDISFTPRPDNGLDFVDRDGNYKAVLHRCPN